MGAEINPVDVFGVAADLPPRVAALLAALDSLVALVKGSLERSLIVEPVDLAAAVDGARAAFYAIAAEAFA